MKSYVHTLVKIAAVMPALSGIAAHAAYLPSSFRDFGQPVTDGKYNRVVKITPATHSVGIYRDEKVKFVDEKTGKSFVWNFNTANSENFPLADIAPADVLKGQNVQAYVWAVPAHGQP
jgi:hypothetical protein